MVTTNESVKVTTPKDIRNTVVHAYNDLTALGVAEKADLFAQNVGTYYLLNVIRPTRLVVPHMRGQGSGVIVNISTAWAFEPSEMFPTSAVFRAGLAAFAKIFADTHAKDNIRMNNVLPGWIDSLPQTDARRDSVPMGRYGRVEEIAATIAFLASDGAGYITGQNIRVDGGLMRSV